MVFGQATKNISDADINANQKVTFYKDTTYILDKLVFVEEGAELTIQPGTVVKFTNVTTGEPSSLIICRGAKIFAEGTATEPIIFTSESDDLSDPNDLTFADNQLWGGVAILGAGITENSGNSTVQFEGLATSETRANYGGTNNADNSGVLKYVSIRHGGTEIRPDAELNGLGLAGVGSGTTLEYIEIFATSDDGIEIWGGAPNLKYAVVAFAEDDSYDWDEVFTGKGQFWFSVQRNDKADHAGELDGTTPDDLTPFSKPTIYNWTHIGAGEGSSAAVKAGWNLRANTGGTIANSIVYGMKGKGLEVQDKGGKNNDSYGRLVAGDLVLESNLFFGNGGTTTIDTGANGIINVTKDADNPGADSVKLHLVANNNAVSDPMFVDTTRFSQLGKFDPRPSATGPAYTNAKASYPSGDAFFTSVDYIGAFSAELNELWLNNWTALDQLGFLTKAVSVKEIAFQNEVAIYPNPATNGFVNVRLATAESVNIQVISVNGKVLNNITSNNQVTTLDLNNLNKGIYFVKVIAQNGSSMTKKVLVN